jgi:long-chain fatty acid transport protein
LWDSVKQYFSHNSQQEAPLRTLFTLALLTLVVSLVFAGGYQINEHGTKAMGMGGAFAAQASDPSAIFFNPAGLTQLKGINVMVGATLIMPTASFTGPTGITGISPTTTDMVKQTFYPPNAYVTYSHGDWAFGIGFFAPYGLGTEWPASWGGTPVALGQYEAYITDLKAFYINPTVAYQVNEQLSIGVGVSYVFGSVTLKQKINLPTLPPGTLPDWNSSLEGTGNAISFNVGIQFKPTKALTIGASYRSLAEIEFSGDIEFTDIPNFNVPPGIPLAALFPDQGGKAKIPMPSNLFAGVAYDFSEAFTLEADFQFVGWSAYKELKITLDGAGVAGETELTEPGDYENAYLLRLGGEYRFTDLAIRAGFVYDASPIPDKSLGPRLPDNDRFEGVVGLGYAFSEMFRVDLAYQYISMKDRTVTGPVNAFPGTYKSSANLFGVNIGLNF